jgi:predicted nucleotidyltransferase
MNKTVAFFLGKYLDQIKNRFHPQEMWVWGSYVYGTPRKGSDLDIVVISNAFKKYRFIQRSSEVTKELKTWADKEIPDIDFLCYTPEEFEKKKNQISLAREITTKGLKVL